MQFLFPRRKNILFIRNSIIVPLKAGMLFYIDRSNDNSKSIFLIAVSRAMSKAQQTNHPRPGRNPFHKEAFLSVINLLSSFEMRDCAHYVFPVFSTFSPSFFGDDLITRRDAVRRGSLPQNVRKI